MAGVDVLKVKELGGWRSLAMVQRYAHLAPAHLHTAVERLVASAVEEVIRLHWARRAVYRNHLMRL
jgi:hypothetical protein